MARDSYAYPSALVALSLRTQVAQNTEVQALLQILNLDPATPQADRSKMRYGHVLLMTDQVLGRIAYPPPMPACGSTSETAAMASPLK